MADQDSREKIRILSWSPNFSTRFLLNIALDPARFDLEFAADGNAVLEAVKANTHGVYVLDAARAATAAPDGVFRDVSALALRHMIRVVAVADKAPDGDFSKMADFGPLAVIPFNFSRARLARAIDSVLTMKDAWQARRDTGSRVKADPNFYKAKRFTE
jgi:DNA-binding NtrC family response regulator